jgi:hypothetical protein
VEFVPSQEEIRDANTDLRGVIYQQAKDEVDRLNKAYPGQTYYVHEINFMNNMMMQPRAMHMMAMGVNGGADAKATVAVGDKQMIAAQVVLASAPQESVLKMIH